jgi:hypothetical protein
MSLEQGHHVALDGYQYGPNQGFESVRLPLDFFDNRTGSGYRTVRLNDARERFKTRDRTGIQIDDRLVVSRKLLGDFFRRWSNHWIPPFLSNFLMRTQASVRPRSEIKPPRFNQNYHPSHHINFSNRNRW